MAVRPYVSTADNNFELACLAALLYSYFASVLAGVSTATAPVAATVTLCKLAVVAYALACVAVRTRPGRLLWLRCRAIAAALASVKPARQADAEESEVDRAHFQRLEAAEQL
jgi:hypothetical protein